jgi:hypothetical protein
MDSSDVGHGSRERSKEDIVVWVFFLQFYAIETGQILGSTDLTPALATIHRLPDAVYNNYFLRIGP